MSELMPLTWPVPPRHHLHANRSLFFSLFLNYFFGNKFEKKKKGTESRVWTRCGYYTNSWLINFFFLVFWNIWNFTEYSTKSIFITILHPSFSSDVCSCRKSILSSFGFVVVVYRIQVFNCCGSSVEITTFSPGAIQFSTKLHFSFSKFRDESGFCFHQASCGHGRRQEARQEGFGRCWLNHHRRRWDQIRRDWFFKKNLKM